MAEKSISIGPIQDAYVYDDDDDYLDDDGNPTGVKHHGIKTDGKIVTTQAPSGPGEVLRLDDLYSGLFQEWVFGDDEGNPFFRFKLYPGTGVFAFEWYGSDGNWYQQAPLTKPSWVP